MASGESITRTRATGHLETWSVALAVFLLAAGNAVLFPLWTGFQGGAAPLASAADALPHLTLALVNAAVLFWCVRALPGKGGVRIGHLLVLGACVRLAYLAVRISQGASAVDPDVQNFYVPYAQQFAGGSYPAMEYPQGALMLFTSAYLLSFGDAARFPQIFPLLTLACDLVTLAVFVRLGERCGSERLAAAFGLFYAVSPFTLVLWYGKFDAAPAALLALGAYLFVVNRHHLSSLTLAAGFLTKWFPGLALAFFVAHLLRAGRPRQALSYAAVASAAILLVFLPFWLVSPEKFLHTYLFHAERPLMGESLLYLPVHLLEPAARLDPTAGPWTDVRSALVTNSVATLLQLGAVGLALFVAAINRPRRESAVALASVAVAAFIIVGRVFSPQYALVLIVAYGVGFIALPTSRGLALAVAPVLMALTFLNYLVWPLWSPFWLAASAAFFALNVAITLLLAYRAVRFTAKNAESAGGARRP